MKKIILLTTIFIFSFCIVTACSNKHSGDTTTQNNRVTIQTETSANADDKNQDTTKLSDTPIEKASILCSDASKKISSLSMAKLALEGKKEDYKFMVSTKGKVIDGEDYIEVIASKVKKENTDGSVSMDTVGQYFVRYDGEKMLIKDMQTGKISELK